MIGYPAAKLSDSLVRLELAVPRERVLLSAYNSWHCVIHRSYVPKTTRIKSAPRTEAAVQAEIDRMVAGYYAGIPYISPAQQERMAQEQELSAWEQEAAKHGAIIRGHRADPNLPEPYESQLRESWERIFDLEKRPETCIKQATFESLELEDIVEATEFSTNPDA